MNAAVGRGHHEHSQRHVLLGLLPLIRTLRKHRRNPRILIRISRCDRCSRLGLQSLAPTLSPHPIRNPKHSHTFFSSLPSKRLLKLPKVPPLPCNPRALASIASFAPASIR